LPWHSEVPQSEPKTEGEFATQVPKQQNEFPVQLPSFTPSMSAMQLKDVPEPEQSEQSRHFDSSATQLNAVPPPSHLSQLPKHNDSAAMQLKVVPLPEHASQFPVHASLSEEHSQS
jgi:hypothetical protein